MVVPATVMFWHLVVTAVLLTTLAALIVGQHLARSVRRLRCVVRCRTATQAEATLERSARDAA